MPAAFVLGLRMEDPQTPRIAFVGSGVMAEVMIRGMLSRGVVPAAQVWASGPREARAAQLREAHGIRTTTDNLEAAREAGIIVLSVKPETLPKVLRQLRGTIRPDQLVMSIIAGARVRRIGEALGHPAVVRCVPNLPCQIHRGMTVWTAMPEVGEEGREAVRRILQTMGQEIYVSEERDLDRASAVHGTGPALIAQFVKALEDAANFIGQSRVLARQSVLQTMIGTAEMILESDRHIGELIDAVTSPGGVTSRALHVLHDGKFSAILTEATDAAFRRTLELGDQLDRQVQGAEAPRERR